MPMEGQMPPEELSTAHPDSAPVYALAFDVGGTDTKVAFVSNRGSLVKLPTLPTSTGGAVGLIAQINDQYLQIQQALRQGKIRDADGTALPVARVCQAVGVGVPGVMVEDTGMTITSANLGWGRFPMRDRLEEALGCSLALGHDVRSGALGEALFTGRKECFFVAIGTGISAGIVLNGQVLNRSGFSGEIGQILLPNPDLNYLGKATAPIPAQATHLPLERIASAEYTARRYALLKGLSPETARPTSRDVFQREREGDQCAHHVIETATQALGVVLAASLATLGDLEVIVGGGQSQEGPAYLERLRQATATHLVNLPEPKFSLSRFGSQAQLLGVAAQAFAKAQVPIVPLTSPS
ncbi:MULTISPECIES: ROK family protein [Mobiluncus]|uniref:ROK family protein n=1 Tax=Mobiluncus holmesii ATCC 35242 TaxID=887899 RepID=E6M4U2_9ACTO|nr:ROK family protein [Mobiluncus curtisii]EFU81490.1 ROK family protein [Mobiluncus holmesii ATCC 35242]MCV0020139.1 ROK family protein [Mobiluncus curtisii]NMW43481.1 ROK family protein [Mobiluncus curtisii]NMW47593.1 ROK family protein [Mobiluncus curtisii]NMW82574.1 ROK family protein [Mobiluncus curtisii]